MRYHVLATDYDGTLAQDGRVDAATVDSLRKLLATGRRLVLVTGRELPELLNIFPEIDLFEWVVAENGGLLYRPSAKEEKPLAEPPSDSFLRPCTIKTSDPCLSDASLSPPGNRIRRRSSILFAIKGWNCRSSSIKGR